MSDEKDSKTDPQAQQKAHADASDQASESTESAETSDTAPAQPRRIRSYVRRGGRLTPAQSKALETLLPHFGVPEQPHLITCEQCFGHPGPLVLEIGFGNGDALTWMAREQPGHCFIGIEVHKPGVGHALRAIADLGLTNAKVMEADAVGVLKHRIAEHSLNGLRIYFPDPWHKKRHNKRRLVQPEFLALAVSRLENGGLLHLATDWEPYAEQMMAVCEAHPELINEAGHHTFAARPHWRPVTRFENRGRRLGHGVWDLIFRRNPDGR